METLGVASPVFSRELNDGRVETAKDPPERGMNAMHEFGPEFDGYGSERVMNGEDAAADTVARFEDERRKPGSPELPGGSEPGRTGPDDDYPVRRIFHSLSFCNCATYNFPTRQLPAP
jgi:hypothetical protein